MLQKKRLFYIAILVVFLVPVLFFGYQYTIKVRHWMVEVRDSTREIKNTLNDLDEKHTPVEKLYTTTVGGKIVPIEKQFGIPLDDLTFLKLFWKSILDDLPEDYALTRNLVKENLETEFASIKPEIAARYSNLSERQRLMIYLLLRVNGSMPIYIPRRNIPSDLESLLMAPRGNCYDYALRLALVLDAFEIPARIISFYAPSLPGHVVVDAYDPIEKTAYLMDSNLNVISAIEDVSEGFFDVIFDWSPERRREFFANENSIIVLPIMLRFLDPGITVFNPSSELNIKYINEQWKNRVILWRKVLTNELDHMIRFWRKNPGHRPRSITEYTNAGILKYQPVTKFPDSKVIKRLLLE